MSTSLMLRSGRNFKNKLWPKQNKFTAVPLAMHHIQIPPRIERGPLDILKALSSTIKQEPDFEEYKYQYGGAFNISSVYKRRIIALAMESGRKAAKWIVAENPHLFQHKSADPYIEAFSPPKVFDENSEVTEETLIEMIQQIRVKSSIKVYELLKEKGFDVSNSTKQQLLELVCFYNCNDKPDENLLETKYYENPQSYFKDTNTWNSKGFPEKLFSEMEKNSESYSAIILGMLKYNNSSDAMALYEEAEEGGIKFDVNMYNSLLENSTFSSYHFSDQMNYILELLKRMERENIEPNLETLNSALKGVLSMRKWFKSRELAWNLYNEFTGIGIKPSLATYYYLLEIFLDRHSVNDSLNYILNALEGQELVPQHVDDFKFFSKAMEKCSYNFGNLPMAYKINDLLNTGRNRNFLCTQYDEAVYYRSYLRSLFEHENLDLALREYCELVPSTFSPDIGTFMILLEFVKLRKGIKCLPRLWSDLKKMTVSDSAKILGLVVAIIDEAGSESTKEMDFQIAKEAWEGVEKGELRTGWDSNLASAFLKIFSRYEEKEMAYKAFDFSNFLKSSFIILNFDSRNLFMKLCIKIQDKNKALECIRYSVNIENSNVEKLTHLFQCGFTLTKDDLSLLKKYTTANS